MGAIKSEKRHEARQQIKNVLRDVEEGTVVSASYNLVLSGTKSRNIEGSITVGEKIAKLGEEETKVELRMYVNTPELKEPIESYITASGEIRRPKSELEKEEILKSDLTSKSLLRSLRNGRHVLKMKRRAENCLLLAELPEIWHLPWIRFMLN